MTVKEEIHWQRTATPALALSPLASPLKTDVLIVGGGLTGCRTALGLAENGVSVTLVDAKEIGWGASGRSGGQCNPMWRKTPDQLKALIGPHYGETLIRTTLTAAHDLFSDIATYGIDCDAVQAGWVQAAHTKTAVTAMRALGKAWIAEGADIVECEGDAVEAASGSPAYRWALRHSAGGHVHPLSLTRGYARAAEARGARLFKGTPVTALTRENGVWQATTPGGIITADKVVLTTNAYTSDLWPGLRQTFYPLVSNCLATAPMTEDQAKTVLPNSVTLSDSRLAIYYARRDRDDRLIFGCVGSDDRVDTLGGFQRLKAGLRTVFPQLAAHPVERKWGGRIAVTPEMMPHLHEPAPGLVAGLGFSGRGIAMTSVMGRALAAKLLGTPDAELPFPVSPVKPLRFHGVARRLIPVAAPAMSAKDRFDTLTNGA
ncbi:MAG: FAD-binding oxidoreductase [Pseudomonadota bacterium]